MTLTDSNWLIETSIRDGDYEATVRRGTAMVRVEFTCDDIEVGFEAPAAFALWLGQVLQHLSK